MTSERRTNRRTKAHLPDSPHENGTVDRGLRGMQKACPVVKLYPNGNERRRARCWQVPAGAGFGNLGGNCVLVCARRVSQSNARFRATSGIAFLTISKAGPPGHDPQTGPKNRYSFTSLRGAKSLLNRSGNLASEKYLRPLKRFSAQGR